MEQYVTPALVLLGSIFGSGGAGALAVRYMLNGSREAIKEVQTTVNRELPQIQQRIARIEGKIGL